VKLFVARFWSDCKESEAVCVNYFCEVVPFWECAEEIVAEVLEGSNLNPNLFCTNHRKDSAPTRVSMVHGLNTGAARKGLPPSMTLSALSRDTSSLRAAAARFLLF
jgi:hypothetical protein